MKIPFCVCVCVCVCVFVCVLTASTHADTWWDAPRIRSALPVTCLQCLTFSFLLLLTSVKWFDTLVDVEDKGDSHHTCNSFILLSFREFLRVSYWEKECVWVCEWVMKMRERDVLQRLMLWHIISLTIKRTTEQINSAKIRQVGLRARTLCLVFFQ